MPCNILGKQGFKLFMGVDSRDMEVPMSRVSLTGEVLELVVQGNSRMGLVPLVLQSTRGEAVLDAEDLKFKKGISSELGNL